MSSTPSPPSLGTIPWPWSDLLDVLVLSWTAVVGQVFFDIEIGGEKAGRIVARLRRDVVPKTAEVPLLDAESLHEWCNLMLTHRPIRVHGAGFEVTCLFVDRCLGVCPELPAAVHGRQGLRLQGLGLPQVLTRSHHDKSTINVQHVSTLP